MMSDETDALRTDLFAHQLLDGEYEVVEPPEPPCHPSRQATITGRNQIKDFIFAPLTPIRGQRGPLFEYADWFILSGLFTFAAILAVVLLWL